MKLIMRNNSLPPPHLQSFNGGMADNNGAGRRIVEAALWLWVILGFAAYLWMLRGYAKPVFELFFSPVP